MVEIPSLTVFKIDYICAHDLAFLQDIYRYVDS